MSELKKCPACNDSKAYLSPTGYVEGCIHCSSRYTTPKNVYAHTELRYKDTDLPVKPKPRIKKLEAKKRVKKLDACEECNGSRLHDAIWKERKLCGNCMAQDMRSKNE